MPLARSGVSLAKRSSDSLVMAVENNLPGGSSPPRWNPKFMLASFVILRSFVAISWDSQSCRTDGRGRVQVARRRAFTLKFNM